MTKQETIDAKRLLTTLGRGREQRISFIADYRENIKRLESDLANDEQEIAYWKNRLAEQEQRDAA